MDAPMAHPVLAFLADERGAESVELGLTGAVVAGGLVAGLAAIQDKVAEQQADLVAKLEAATAR